MNAILIVSLLLLPATCFGAEKKDWIAAANDNLARSLPLLQEQSVRLVKIGESCVQNFDSRVPQMAALNQKFAVLVGDFKKDLDDLFFYSRKLGFSYDRADACQGVQMFAVYEFYARIDELQKYQTKMAAFGKNVKEQVTDPMKKVLLNGLQGSEQRSVACPLHGQWPPYVQNFTDSDKGGASYNTNAYYLAVTQAKAAADRLASDIARYKSQVDTMKARAENCRTIGAVNP